MQTFILREEHVKLLRAASVDTNLAEWGAPTIDPKRPFGNGDITGDMARILGMPDPSELGKTDRERFERLMLKLFRELGDALQVVLAAGSFAPGTYVQGLVDGRHSWRRVDRLTD